MSFQNDEITGIPAPLPTDYDRQYSFTDYQVLNPGEPLPGQQLDIEFNAVEKAMDETQARLRLIQRDDGALANESVGRDQLRAEVRIGVNTPSDWKPFTRYEVKDSVIVGDGAWYVAGVSHVSSATFQDDVDAGYWDLLVNLAPFTTEAKHWATYPVDQLVPEGNGTDDYSAWHHRYYADQAQAAAESARVDSQEARDESQQARAGSEAARDEAQDLVNGAIATASIYPDTATGLANTEPEGDTNRYFSTPSADGEQFLDLYKNESGTAEFVDSYPNSSALTQTIDTVDRLVDTATYTFDPVAVMKADTRLRVGDRVRTLGYYEPGDGGGNDYVVVDAGTGTDDGGSFIDLDGSGLQAQGLFMGGKRRPEQYGGRGDGVSDDTASIEAIKASGHLPFLSAGKVYLVTTTDPTEMYAAEGYGALTNGFIHLDFSQVLGRRGLVEDQDDPATGPLIRRMASTTRDMELFVDASVGVSGDGSQTSPFKSINEALSVVPRDIYHKVRIYLADGLYDGPGNAFNLYNYFVTPRSTAGFQILGHVPENPLYTDTDPSAVVIGNASSGGSEDNFVIGGVIGDSDDTKIAGVTFDGRVQTYGCNFAFFYTHFKTGKNATLVGGHSGRVKLNNCGFFDCYMALGIGDLAHYYIEGPDTTYSGLSRVGEVRNGSILMFDENAAGFAASGTIIIEDECICRVGDRRLGGFRLSQNTEGNPDLLEVKSTGDVICARAFIGKLGVPSLPSGEDSYSIYQASDGSIYLRVSYNGEEKSTKLYDFPSNSIQ